MAKKKDKRRRVKIGKKANLLFWLAALAIVLIGAVVISSQLDAIGRQEAQRRVDLSQIQDAQAQQEYLRQVLSYVSSEEYKRSIAHDQLGLLAPNEIRFIPAN